MIDVSVNGKTQRVDAEPDTPLLWVIRESLGLTGTKYGCGMALCGACTVHLDGAPVRSCVTPVSAARGKRVTTIEGLAQGAAAPPGAGRVDRSGRAAVRLLSVRPGHERRRAPVHAEGPDGCGHRRRHEREHLPMRHLPADPRGDQAGRRPNAEGGLTMVTRSSPTRRAFLKVSATLSSGVLLGFRLPGVTRRRRADHVRDGDDRVRPERVHPHQQGERRDDPREQGRDGPGRLHLAADAHRRGAGGGPAPREGRRRAGRPGLQPPGVRHAVHRRQPEHRQRVGAAPQGGGGRARDAPGGGGRHLEGRPRGPSRRERGGDRPRWPAAHLRAARRAGGGDAGAGGPAAEGPVPVQDHREVHEAAGQPGEGHRGGDVRPGRQGARHADRGSGPAARLRRRPSRA